MNFIKTNINYLIKFKPTEKAKDIYKEEMNKIFDKFNTKFLPENYNKLNVDEEGYSHMQMWDFMKVFGQYFGMGRESIIQTDVMIQYYPENKCKI